MNYQFCASLVGKNFLKEKQHTDPFFIYLYLYLIKYTRDNWSVKHLILFVNDLLMFLRVTIFEFAIHCSICRIRYIDCGFCFVCNVNVLLSLGGWATWVCCCLMCSFACWCSSALYATPKELWLGKARHMDVFLGHVLYTRENRAYRN